MALIPKKHLSPKAIDRGIERIGQRIAELKAFNIGKVQSYSTPELDALSAAVRDTLDRCFGEGSGAYNRFANAVELSWSPGVYTDSYPKAQHFQAGTKRYIERSVALLEEAQRSLREDLTDSDVDEVSIDQKPRSANSSSKVFVVHGHDEGALHSLARFLERLSLNAIILHEQPDQGQTIIEKFEAYASQVAFAVVLLTPDDIGAAKAANGTRRRARQNVLFELGYLVGKLGRGRTCLLRKGDTEIPSDLYGVIYTELDEQDGWKVKLARELRAAGLRFDAENVL